MLAIWIQLAKLYDVKIVFVVGGYFNAYLGPDLELGKLGRWVDGWMDGWMDGQIHRWVE